MKKGRSGFARRFARRHRTEDAVIRPVDAYRAGADPGEAVLVTNLTIRTRLECQVLEVCQEVDATLTGMNLLHQSTVCYAHPPKLESLDPAIDRHLLAGIQRLV